MRTFKTFDKLLILWLYFFLVFLLHPHLHVLLLKLYVIFILYFRNSQVKFFFELYLHLLFLLVEFLQILSLILLNLFVKFLKFPLMVFLQLMQFCVLLRDQLSFEFFNFMHHFLSLLFKDLSLFKSFFVALLTNFSVNINSNFLFLVLQLFISEVIFRLFKN